MKQETPQLGTKEFNNSAMEMFGGKPKQLTDLEIAIKLEEIEREETKQQTALEWLEDCLTEQYPNGKFVWNTRADIEALFKQAKEMEKEQIIDACEKFGNLNGVDIKDYEQYYKEKFNK
jgi:hypothetical protein